MSTWNPENDVDLLSGSEDEEEVAMKRDYHGREALLFVVDANLQSAGVERLLEALNIIRTAFISGILDLIGLIFANTKHSPPPLESSALDSIVMPENCAVFLPLRQLTKPIVEHYLEFMGGVETQFGEMYGLAEPDGRGRFDLMIQLLEKCGKKLNNAKIVYLTDVTTPHPSSSNHFQAALQKASDLEGKEFEFHVIPMVDDFDYEPFYKEFITLSRAIELDAFQVPDAQMLREILADRKLKQDFLRRCLGHFSFYLGPNLSMSVQYYNYFQRRAYPRKVQILRRDNSVVRSKRKDEESQDILHEYQIKTTGGWYSCNVGGKNLRISMDQLNRVRDLHKPRMMLLGFKHRSSLPEVSYSKPSNFMYPDDQSRKSIPRYVALVPVEAPDKDEEKGYRSLLCGDGFKIVYLPESKHIRHIDMFDWNNTANTASDEGVEFFQKIIKKLRVEPAKKRTAKSDTTGASAPKLAKLDEEQLKSLEFVQGLIKDQRLISCTATQLQFILAHHFDCKMVKSATKAKMVAQIEELIQIMSLQFQNDCGDSVKQAIIEELQNLLSSDTGVLQQAEKRTKQLEYTEGYGVYLSEIIMNQAHELPLRQIAIVMLTRYVENHWTDDQEAGGKAKGEQAKRTIRNILPNGLYDPNSKIRSSVAHTISTIAATDYPHSWAELFDIIVKCLGGNEDSIHGAMQVLQDFTYDVEQIKELGPQNYSIKTRVSAIRILKPLFASIATLITNKEEQSTMMSSILTNFMDKLMHYLSMNSGAGSSFLLRSEIIKVFTHLVNETPKYIHPFMDRVLPIIWQLLTQIAETYVKVSVNQTESNPLASGDSEEDDEQTNFQTLIIQILDKLRSCIKNVLADLIYITIVYIQLSEEQLEDWQDDPEKFVDDEDDGGVELTVRMCGRDILLAINDEFGAKAIQPLQEALGRHFSVAEAEKAANNPNWWKIQEACMDAVHSFRDIILLGDTTFDLLNYLTIVRNLLVHQESPPLMLAEILDVTLCSLSPEKSHILRISAVRTLNEFLQANETSEGEKRTLLVSKLPGFLDGIMALVPGCKAAVLALLMEALTIMVKFDAEFAFAGQAKITPLTIAVFLKYTEDPFVLETVQDLIKALCQRKECLGPLQEKFIPTIVSILGLTGAASTEKQDIALDPPLSNPLLETAFPAVINCVLHTDDHAVMVAGGECLRSFINVSPEQICSYKNGEGINCIMQVVATVLLNPMNSEMTAGGQIGRLNVDMLLKAVISKMQNLECLKVIMNLVLIFAHLFLTQMDAVLNFLSTVPGPNGEPAMQFVLTNWLSRQNSFFGTYERKVTTMALCKLFEYGVATQDNRLTTITFKELVDDPTDTRRRTRSVAAATQKWVTIPALVLISEYQHFQEGKTDEPLTDSEEDGEDGEEPGTPGKPRYISDLFESDEDNAEDEQQLQELLKEINYQGDITDNLQ
ncbi:hypothetical protein M5D96_001976, partial [Drosophila gunungcola]